MDQLKDERRAQKWETCRHTNTEMHKKKTLKIKENEDIQEIKEKGAYE